MARFLRKNFNVFNNMQNKFVLPERFKGTVIEKWALYWKNMYIDYKSMVADLVVDIQEKPVKSLYITGGLVATYKLMKTNPSLNDFEEDLKKYSCQLMLVNESCQNPVTVQHFKYLERSFNEGLIRHTNLGIASLLWVDDYADDCCLYKARCEYTKPGYLSVFTKAVDFGFMGKWWNIYRRYQNFDVNDETLSN